MSFQATEPLTHDNAHGRPEKLDPRVNGPFLDDIRREQEKAYREQRMKGAVVDDVAPEQEEEDNASESE